MSYRSPLTVATPARSRRPRPWPTLLRQVATDPIDRAVFVVALVAVGFGESILLPFDFTQRISVENWRYFGLHNYPAFTVAFAFGMAWVLTLQVHAMRRVVANARSGRAGGRGGPFGALAAVVSLLPSFLCCSPIVPTLVGLFGLSATTQLRTTGSIEYFFATKQNLLLLGSLLLVVASGLWSMRKLARAACLDAGGCAVDAESLEERRPADAGALVAATGADERERSR